MQRSSVADALGTTWGDERFDVVLGNPPFLSQLAAATTRGGASRHGGGPYADAAAEFLALAVRLARPDGGRVGLVLPQSILASRDAGRGARRGRPRGADLTWSWWSPRPVFDAQVLVCALVARAPPRGDRTAAHRAVEPTSSPTALGVPPLPAAGDRRARSATGPGSRANFRDQYYGLVPAVVDGRRRARRS